jgi:hypothetical protein
MGRIDVGKAVGSGFGLIRKKPEAIIVWGALGVGFVVLTALLVWPLYAAQFARLAEIVRSGANAAAATPDLAAIQDNQTISLLPSVGNMVLGAVLQCAVFRAVLRPEDDRWAYLRLGEAELILLGITFAGVIAWFLALLLGGLVIGVFAGVLAALRQPLAAAVVAIVLGGALLWASIYGFLRLIFYGPMLVDHGRLEIGPGLALTRGRTWPLFLIGLSVFAILIAAELVVMGFAAAAVFAVVLPAAGTAPDALLHMPVSTWAPRLTPLLVVAAVVAIPFYGALHAVWSAPLARAYLDLRADPAEAF